MDTRAAAAATAKTLTIKTTDKNLGTTTSRKNSPFLCSHFTWSATETLEREIKSYYRRRTAATV
jgi:hypothetical protein